VPSYDAAGVKEQHFAACRSGQACGTAPGGRHSGGTLPPNPRGKATPYQRRKNQKGKTSAELDSNVASKLIEKNVDYFIAALSSGNLNAQIKIEAESAKELAVEAWNSQWDCLLLGAIINNSVMCNLQCDKPVELINEASYLNVTNYELRGTRGISKELTTEDETWIEKHYKKARELLDHQRYNTAVHCMATYTWHSLPNVQLAILWSGIESLFNVSTEVGFRVSLYISNYLSNNHEEVLRW
jgi:hypothetical protein